VHGPVRTPPARRLQDAADTRRSIETHPWGQAPPHAIAFKCARLRPAASGMRLTPTVAPISKSSGRVHASTFPFLPLVKEEKGRGRWGSEA